MMIAGFHCNQKDSIEDEGQKPRANSQQPLSSHPNHLYQLSHRIRALFQRCLLFFG